MKKFAKPMLLMLLLGGICMSTACETPKEEVNSNPTAAAEPTPENKPAAIGRTEIPEIIIPPRETSEPEPIDPARLAAENKVPRLPFPQRVHNQYAVAPMMPTNKTQDEIEEMTIHFFEEILLNDMIVDSNSPANKDEFRLVFRHYQNWGGSTDISHLTVSESHGYGMMMLAYMAGSEDRLNLKPEEWIYESNNLKDYFDAMLRTVLAFPSITSGSNNKLFAWKIAGLKSGNKTGYDVVDNLKLAPFSRPTSGTSATDGDIDIIYALLLADKQWGSEGIYDYKEIALDMLESLWEYCVHPDFKTLRLGDWAGRGSLADVTRPSDFILSHLKTYAEVDPNHDWQAVIDATYGVIKDIRDSQNALGNNNGLMPDFVVREGDKWVVPEGKVLEADNDNAFAYNACRVPWRLGTDYLLFGDTKIGDSSLLAYIIKPIDDFGKSKKGLNLMGAFKMDGSSAGYADAHLFGPPFIVAAAAHGADQEWVNTAWGWSGLDRYNYDNYADYIKMLVFITASGNYWRP